MSIIRKFTLTCLLDYGIMAAHGLLLTLGTTGRMNVQAGSKLCIACATDGVDVYSPQGNQRSGKRIAFIRHGRSYMNDFIDGIHYGQPGFTDIFPDVSEYKGMYYDSPLGPTGEQQVDRLNEKLQRLRQGDAAVASELSLSMDDANFLDDLDLIVVSPLTRALQTMDKGLYPSVRSSDVPVVAIPQAAERIFLISDLGKTRRQLKEAYSYVDFDSGFPPELGEEDVWHYVPTTEEVENYKEWRPHGEGQKYACLGEAECHFNRRMEELFQWLTSRPESTIAVVCHAGVILWFLGEIVDNCAIRIVEFESLHPKRYYEPPIEQAKELK